MAAMDFVNASFRLCESVGVPAQIAPDQGRSSENLKKFQNPQKVIEGICNIDFGHKTQSCGAFRISSGPINSLAALTLP